MAEAAAGRFVDVIRLLPSLSLSACDIITGHCTGKWPGDGKMMERTRVRKGNGRTDEGEESEDAEGRCTRTFNSVPGYVRRGIMDESDEKCLATQFP